jgi:hypothetical protein
MGPLKGAKGILGGSIHCKEQGILQDLNYGSFERCERNSRWTDTLQRTNAENMKQIFPEKELRGRSPNFQIHVSVSDFFIPTIDLLILLQEICGPIPGNLYKSLTDT